MSKLPISKPLSAYTVLNTRPARQALQTSQLIESLGGHAVLLPSIEIHPIAIDSDWLDAQLMESDILIITSQNAINPTVGRALLRMQKQNPKTIIGAIGQTSAQLLRQLGLPEVFIPQRNDSEGLLDCTELAQVKGRRITLLKGQDGRQLLARQLQHRGAVVTTIDTYRRQCPSLSQHYCHELWRNNKIDLILGMSQDSINNLFQLFGQQAEHSLVTTPWLLWSQRLCDSARMKGIKQFFVVHNNDIFHSLISWAESKESPNG